MPHDWVVWGGGGHGRVVAEVICDCGDQVTGWIDRDPARGTLCTERQLIGMLEDGEIPAGITRVALGIGDNKARKVIATLLGRSLMPPVIAPTAWVSRSAMVGEGAVVMTRAVIHAGSVVGTAAIVNTAATVEHDCRIGDHAHVSPGAILTGGVSVGEGCWVGAGATILPGISIGEWAVIGAGAVVTADVPAGSVVAGVPARPIARGRG